MNEKLLIKQLVDTRGQALWKAINDKFKISIEFATQPEYGVFTSGQNVVFSVRENNLCKDSFAHEMLHVQFCLQECYIGQCFKNLIRSDELLSRYFSIGFLDHISNCLEHIKMLKDYLDLGFQRELFIQDFSENKCSEETLQLIEEGYAQFGKKHSSVAVAYISTLFAMKACPNNKFDYSLPMEKLKALDPELFKSIGELIMKWEGLNIVNPLPYEDDYRMIIAEFYSQLKRIYHTPE